MFLQPWLLLALPLVAIPIVIHLVHLRRYQSVPWGAMRFLLSATRMASGYSKLKQWIILALRALAIAGLIFFMARPLSSGISAWVGGDSSEVIILLLDRSPSMQQRMGENGESKLQVGLQRFIEWNRLRGGESLFWVSTGDNQLTETDKLDLLLDDPKWNGCALSSNIPAMIDLAKDYLQRNAVPRATIWICSDLKQGDWRPEDGLWESAREAFSQMACDVRFQVLDMGGGISNRSIQLDSVKQEKSAQGDEIALSFHILAATDVIDKVNEKIQVELVLGEVRSVLDVELVQGEGVIKGFRVPVAGLRQRASDVLSEEIAPEIGWGYLQIPADSNPADNRAYFCFEPPSPRRTLIVTSDQAAVEAFSISASISPESNLENIVESMGRDQLDSVDWDRYALVIWHEQLPEGNEEKNLSRFVDTRGQLLLLPPLQPNGNQAFGIQWQKWVSFSDPANAEGEDREQSGDRLQDADNAVGKVEQWRNDSAVLGNTLSGGSLPLSDLEVYRYCQLKSNGTELATLHGNHPLLVRSENVSESAKGNIYAICTTATLSDSSFATDGISLYIMVQRLIEAGATRVGNAKNHPVSRELVEYFRTSVRLESEGGLSSASGEQAGVFSVGKVVHAQNRSSEEDIPTRLDNRELTRLFGKLTWYRVEASNPESQLIREIWRWFVILMLVALIVESYIGAPNKRRTHPVSMGIGGSGLQSR